MPSTFGLARNLQAYERPSLGSSASGTVIVHHYGGCIMKIRKSKVIGAPLGVTKAVAQKSQERRETLRRLHEFNHAYTRSS